MRAFMNARTRERAARSAFLVVQAFRHLDPLPKSGPAGSS